MSDEKNPHDLGKMKPEHSNLLMVAQHHDAVIFGRNVKINKAIQQAGQQEVTMPAGTTSLQHIQVEDEDPFGGNANNRRVAARIAKMSKRKFLNNSEPTHVGDPEKAARDVARSLEVNPETELLSGDEQVMLDVDKTLTPTPGSPAAQKSAVKPATWTP